MHLTVLHRYGTAGFKKASSCSPLIPLNRTDDDDADKDAIMVVGFNLSDPMQKGLFFSVVGVIGLIFLCAGIFIGQVRRRSESRFPTQIRFLLLLTSQYFHLSL